MTTSSANPFLNKRKEPRNSYTGLISFVYKKQLYPGQLKNYSLSGLFIKADILFFKGEKITIHSVARSRELGIETVYQEQALSEQQTMWRNIFMGREITNRFGFLKVEAEKKETEDILRKQILEFCILRIVKNII